MDTDTINVVFILITAIFVSLVRILIYAVIVSGIFHICSKVTKRDRFAFWKVFPYVFVAFIIFNVLHYAFLMLVFVLAEVTA